jgi:HD-GYP domain-containing protein (c-di-GMP phosphodiesterase class II)
LRATLRKEDTAFRYGGDEFAIILVATDAKSAKRVVERLRLELALKSKDLYPTTEATLAFSTGIAQFPDDAKTGDGLIFLADTALYFSKRQGKGRNTLVSDLGTASIDAMGDVPLDQIYALAATVDARDSYTYGHSKRISVLCEMTGTALGLPPKELADLRGASLLHDIGKVGIPDSVLSKPGKLIEGEYAIIREHPVEGARIVSYIKALAPLVPFILHHHEWYNGKGYPKGLKGEDIPLGARIIAVADAYDAMTTSRPYKGTISQRPALEELRRCSGTQFDPEIVEAFCQAMSKGSGGEEHPILATIK